MAAVPKYDPEKTPKQTLRFAKAGKCNWEIAKCLGVSRKTLNEWEKKYPEMSDALARGKQYCLSQIVTSTYKKAVGYDTEEVRIITVPTGKKVFNPDTGKDEPEMKISRIERMRRHIPPSEGAAKILLNAWDPEHYKDSLEVTGANKGPIRYSKEIEAILHLSPDELESRVQEIIRREKEQAGKKGKPTKGNS